MSVNPIQQKICKELFRSTERDRHIHEVQEGTSHIIMRRWKTTNAPKNHKMTGIFKHTLIITPTIDGLNSINK